MVFSINRCNLSEKELEDEKVMLRSKMDEEGRSHTEICNFLHKHVEELEKKLEEWQEKYDTDIAQMDHDLEVLQTTKARDLEHLNELTKLVS